MLTEKPAAEHASLLRELETARQLAIADHRAGLVNIISVQVVAQRLRLTALLVEALVAEVNTALGRRPVPAVLDLLERARAVAEAAKDATSLGRACYATAHVYNNLERPDLALPWVERAAAADPGIASLSFAALQASLLSQCGRFDEADACYAHLMPEVDTEASTPATQKIQGLLLNNMAWHDYRCGRMLRGLERSQAAQARLEAASEPHALGDMLACRARLLACLNRADEAEALCREALAQTDKASPWTARLWRELALLLQGTGRQADALAAAETGLAQALQLQLPALAGFCSLLGDLTEAEGDSNRASNLRQRAMEIERDLELSQRSGGVVGDLRRGSEQALDRHAAVICSAQLSPK